MLSGTASVSAPSKIKRLAKMTAAAALSAGLVGAFSIPAYATVPEAEGDIEPVSAAQVLDNPVVDAEVADTPLATLATDVSDNSAEVAAAEQRKAVRDAAADRAAEEAAAKLKSAQGEQASQEQSQGFGGGDVPAGEGASGIVNAALAQLGDAQDCTALVERSLRAVGIPAGDLGTQPHEYAALGAQILTTGSYAPGDILIYQGNHVAVYIGNGQVVHGGWDGFTTAIAGTGTMHGQPTHVARFF